ncbi:MAG: hypothetical protein ACNA8L_12615 [Luteolibacter sp.]
MHRRATKKITLSLVALVLIAVPLFYPNPNGPTGIQWLIAIIEGRGKPHYPVTGSVESNLEAFFTRNPKLRPQWRNIPDEENGLLQAMKLIKDGKILDPAVKDPLIELLAEKSLDSDAAATHLKQHHELIDEIRRIGRMADRSISFEPIKELPLGTALNARGFKAMADLLALSMKDQLHQSDIAGALDDFAAINTLAGHLANHEAPSLLHATIAILMRMSAQGALRNALPKIPHETDLSGFLQILESTPAHHEFIARLLRGEAVSTASFSFIVAASPDHKNPIWNFPALIDAYAERILEAAEFSEKTSPLTTADLVTLDRILSDRSPSLSKDAREHLQLINFGRHRWMKGYDRTSYLTAHTLAALQLHEIERTTGPVTSATDPRLSTLATEPFTDLPFHFDPATRQLTPDPTSALANDADETRIIQLPYLPTTEPSQNTDY